MSNNEFAQEQEIYATLVEINQEPTELYKILKFENLVAGGGEAKQVISDGYVYLNGELETRKRKKVYAGDLVSFNGQHFQIALKGETDQYEVVQEVTPQQKPSHSSPKNRPSQRGTAEKSEAPTGEQGKNGFKANKLRKPISF